MLNLAVALLVVGCILLLIEAFIPGFGVFGATGIVMLVVSSIILVIFTRYGFVFVFFEVCALAAGVLVFIEIAKRKNAYKNLILNENLKNDVLEDLSHFVGRTGVAQTALRPVGKVDIGGDLVEAYSEENFIKAGEKVEVVCISDRNIIVRPAPAGAN